MKRYIRHNKRTGIPQHHVVFDCETVPVPDGANPKLAVHKLALGAASYFRFEGGQPTRPDRLDFVDRDSFWQWLLGKCHRRHPVWAWSHNAGFDLSALRLWQLLESGELYLSRPGLRKTLQKIEMLQHARPGGLCVTTDPPTVIGCYTPAGARIIFLDLINWLPLSLKEIGEELNCAKLDMPGELGSTEEWMRYCKRDVEILQRAVVSILHFVSSNDLGNLRITAASQSMALYRHRCMGRPITIDTDKDVKRLERQSYYGGRCEVYYAGSVLREGMGGLSCMVGVKAGQPWIERGPVYHLDLAGAYPAAMRDGIFPVRYLRSEVNPRPADVLAGMAAQCCVASVRINAGNEPWPLRRGKEVWWVIGRFDTVLCGPELERALKSGDVEHVYLAQWYVADRPFREFVDAVWGMRAEYKRRGDNLLSRLCKCIGNALHGKFAQRQSRWSLLPDVLGPKMWGGFVMVDKATGQLRRYRCIAGYVQVQEEDEEKDDNFPLIAAYATSYHRERMRELKLVAGYRNVLYEDADSLHVTQAGKDALCRADEIAEGRLGKLRIEAVADKAVYVGPKDYQLGNKVVCGGLTRKSVVDAHGLWHHTKFLGLGSILASYPPDGPVSIDEEMERPYHPIRGRVARDGWVYPLRV